MFEVLEDHGINPDTTPVDVFMSPRFEQMQRELAWELEYGEDGLPYPQ